MCQIYINLKRVLLLLNELSKTECLWDCLSKQRASFFYTLRKHRKIGGQCLVTHKREGGRTIFSGTGWVLESISVEETSSQLVLRKLKALMILSPRQSLRDDTAHPIYCQLVGLPEISGGLAEPAGKRPKTGTIAKYSECLVSSYSLQCPNYQLLNYHCFTISKIVPCFLIVEK